MGCVLACVLTASVAEAQTGDCDRSAARLWGAVPWNELVERSTVVPPGADEEHLFRTLEVDGQLLVAGVLRTEGYRGRPNDTDSLAVWRLRCVDRSWRYIDGFVDGTVNTVSLCQEGAELAVMRIESGTRVEGTFVRIEAKFDTCGVACGTYARRFLLVNVGGARADRAFACTTHSDMYVVSDEQAASYGCGEQERRRLVRYASGGRIRSRLRRPQSGPWVVFRWNDTAFVDENGQSECDPRIPWPR